MSKINRSKTIVEKTYQSCLKLFWNKQFDEVRSRIFRAIESSKEPQTDFFLYRLWIQTSSHDGDLSSLEQLKGHLNTLATSSTDNRDLYYSLIALIHYEIGEVEAAQLTYQSINQSIGKRSLYQRELQFIVDQEQPQTREQLSWLADYPIQDYIVFENVALTLCERSQFDLALGVAGMLSSKFQDAFLVERIQYELISRLGHGTDLIEIAKFLWKKFPKNEEFHSALCLGHFKENQFQSAADLMARRENQDCASLTFLGNCFLELYRQHGRDEDYLKSRGYVEKAIRVGKESGDSIETATNLKVRLQEMKGSDIELSGRFWMAKLNAHNFATIRTKEESEIKYIRRPLGATAKPGDLCFLVYEEKKRVESDKVWRLAALYKVVDEAEWDPINRYQNLLTLQFRHEVAIPLDVYYYDRRNATRYEADDSRRYDVYEMDQSAFDSVIESVCDSLGDDDQLSIALNQLRIA